MSHLNTKTLIQCLLKNFIWIFFVGQILSSAGLSLAATKKSPATTVKTLATSDGKKVKDKRKPLPTKSEETSTLSTTPSQTKGDPNQLIGVTVKAEGKFARLIIESTRPLKYREVRQDKSWVLYMLEPVVCQRPPTEKGFGELVEEIRYAYKDAKVPFDKPLLLEYVSFRLTEPALATFNQQDIYLAVELKPGGVPAPLPSPPPPVAIPSPLAAAPPPTSAVSELPAEPTLSDLLKLGLTNHVPLRLAVQEKSLSKIRYTEAVRNMLPAITGTYSKSNGLLLGDLKDSLDDTRFFRKEYGVQLGQPIFQSGRLYFLTRQAGYQKKIAEQNILKIRADMTVEIIRAYYNVIRSQNTLRARRELYNRSSKVIEMSRKKRQLDLISEIDSLAAESLFNQTYYRLLSDEKELDVARLRLAALLSLKEPLPETLAEPKERTDPKKLVELNLPVETLVDLGMSHRPEMLIADLTARQQVYAEKSAKAERRLKVDATYFEGRGGGAAENDPLTLRRSWRAGIQASMSFLGNSIKGTRSRERTAPDFGETTATNVDGWSANVGFLDSLKLIGDHRQVRINRDRSIYERDQARRNVDVDVREAYYNVQKAKIQIKGAQTELEYRTRELAVVRQKERMNLVEPQQTLSAENSYGDAVNNYEEALSFYQVSLASLEKAMGMPLEAIPDLR